MTDDPMQEATAFIRQVVADPTAFPRRFVSLPLDPELIVALLSRQRLRMVQYLREHGPVGSVEQLAADLGRNYASVSRDVGALRGAGLLESHQEGHRRRLQATRLPIVIG